MSNGRSRIQILDFCYDYIKLNGIQTSRDLLERYKEQDKSVRKSGECSRQALSQSLTRNKVFVKVKEDFGYDKQKNKIFKYDVVDIDALAKKLASYTHQYQKPKKFTTKLRQKYYDALEAQSTQLNTMKERI